MRPDMAKILVERGHAGTAWSRHQPKGWASRCRFRHADDEPLEAWVAPIRRPMFSENLKPLRRYLAAQVGRPWDLVYSEIRARIDCGNAVQYHILQHLFDRLALHVTVDHDKVLWYAPRWGRHQRLGAERRDPTLYVCPQTGLLKRTRFMRKPDRPKEPPERIPGDHYDHDFRRIAGQWYELTWYRDAEGARVIRTKRQISRKEKKRLGILT